MNIRLNRRAALFAAAGALAVVSAASADVILTFQFNDLDGMYTMSTATATDGGTFQATAADTGGLKSAGDVTRLLATAGSANFAPGFVSGADSSDFRIDLSVDAFTGNYATGSGSFKITDADGDTYEGLLDGSSDPSLGWFGDGAGNYFFNGLISSATFYGGGATFDGPDGSSFTKIPGLYPGALVQLFTVGSGGFFSSNFDDVNTLVIANIVPAPGALALAGLGGLFAARRRTR